MIRRQFMGRLGTACCCQAAVLVSAGRWRGRAPEPNRECGRRSHSGVLLPAPRRLGWDFIPFFKDGTFHLFYLLDWRDRHKHGEGTPWYQISTRDFVHFAEHGRMLPRGTAEKQISMSSRGP